MGRGEWGVGGGEWGVALTWPFCLIHQRRSLPPLPPHFRLAGHAVYLMRTLRPSVPFGAFWWSQTSQGPEGRGPNALSVARPDAPSAPPRPAPLQTRL